MKNISKRKNLEREVPAAVVVGDEHLEGGSGRRRCRGRAPEVPAAAAGERWGASRARSSTQKPGTAPPSPSRSAPPCCAAAAVA